MTSRPCHPCWSTTCRALITWCPPMPRCPFTMRRVEHLGLVGGCCPACSPWLWRAVAPMSSAARTPTPLVTPWACPTRGWSGLSLRHLPGSFHPTAAGMRAVVGHPARSTPTELTMTVMVRPRTPCVACQRHARGDLTRRCGGPGSAGGRGFSVWRVKQPTAVVMLGCLRDPGNRLPGSARCGRRDREARRGMPRRGCGAR